MEVGFPDVENFCLELESKYRSEVVGNLRDKGTSSPEWRIVKLCMELKMIDERKINSKLETARYNIRKKIEEQFGKNSRRSRNLIKKLRQEASKNKVNIMKKNEAKLKHLRRKYRKNEEEKVDKVPEVIEDLNLENLSVFNRKKYDEKPVTEYDTEIIGDLTLTENERLVLRLPPKFSVEENLPPEGLALEGEMSFTKARMTLRQEEEARMEEEDDEG